MRSRTLAFALTALTSFSASAAINTAAIVGSTASPTCLDYRVVGICYWLLCTPFGCKIKTSTKVRHYVPDAVVSAYANTGENPWVEVSPMGRPNSTAQAGNNGTTNHNAENNISKFKNADVIGHPGGAVFSKFAAASGYACPGATLPFVPYMLSTLDTLAWRHGIPEVVYPESLMPGLREVGGLLSTNMWGSIYPRSGFIHQSDDFKAAAVIAQRAGDITTRLGQPHVYVPMRTFPMPGYWPAGELLEDDYSTGKWQQLTPSLSPTCATFPTSGWGIGTDMEAANGAYAWALWRPYSCCQRRGQIFLGSTDFQ
ncbi:TIGR03756 family integrating conjugative element protein [Pseudomonas protegens]|uniref:Integrating conjugative element protein, PFL_4710 family n=2 Tax=Pseudomonas protegens TaxID=380021 RepID=Q4K7J0_PSEF5|nr:integrating conjugative element protein, PFL_4710 family [Pseudomonas protegens Pf-5]ASE21881.1 TIGR03756 family integrating conjugative element protein [Pseudomonas protegens]OBZ20211.1 integrating conjugative element protein [Pseudomonas protegens]OBZ21314.1 integrating conjugative element protein [Pseudomonas protegens]OKK40585.1 integrating conjugative element protein [Pseudomonas protegens]